MQRPAGAAAAAAGVSLAFCVPALRTSSSDTMGSSRQFLIAMCLCAFLIASNVGANGTNHSHCVQK